MIILFASERVCTIGDRAILGYSSLVLPVGVLWDLYQDLLSRRIYHGSSIAFVIHSLDPSLFVQLIVIHSPDRAVCTLQEMVGRGLTIALAIHSLDGFLSHWDFYRIRISIALIIHSLDLFAHLIYPFA